MNKTSLDWMQEYGRAVVYASECKAWQEFMKDNTSHNMILPILAKRSDPNEVIFLIPLNLKKRD